MYERMLIPLDGSKTAEKVLPYARALSGTLKIPVELLSVVDIAALAVQMSGETLRYLDKIVIEAIRRGEEYLKRVAETFPGVSVKCAVEKGTPEDLIIEKGAAASTLTAMATHGRTGLNRLLLGSIAEKVLRGATNPLLLIRASDEAKSEGQATLRSVIVPLDGSELAESVLPTVVELAKRLRLEVLLLRVYRLPASFYAPAEDYVLLNYEEIMAALKEEAQRYLEKKVEELKGKGIEKISFVAVEGFAAEEIIELGRKTPDNFIAMCTHGRSGVKRWVLGSVTEKVVRLSGDPVLVVRAR